jgi:hypothetical protein
MGPEPLFDPIPITYRGLYADRHLVDAQQFGRSLVAVSKLANSICHELFCETITHDPRSYRIRFCVGPSKENGLVQEIFAVVNSGHLPLFAPILIAVGRKFTELAIDAVVERVLNRKKEPDSSLDKLHELAMSHNEFARQVHQGHMRDKAFLQKMIASLANENRASVRQIPEPVGRTVRLVQIGSEPNRGIIDEPAAEVLRSPDKLRLGHAVEYDVRIHGVFKTNGACKIELIGQRRIVSGKIADPALEQPGNVYTKALNEGAVLHVVAQPITKDGKLHKLFITSAELVPTDKVRAG